MNPLDQLIQQSTLLLERGEGQEAVRLLQTVEGRPELPPEYFVLLIQAHRGLQQYRAADEIAEDGLARFPKSRSIAAEHALNSIEQEDWPHAVKRLERVRALRPSAVTGKTFARLVEAYREAGDLPAADRVLEEGLARFPDRLDLKREQHRLLATARGPGRVAGGGVVVPTTEKQCLAKVRSHVKKGENLIALEKAAVAAEAHRESLELQLQLLDLLVECSRQEEAVERGHRLLVEGSWKDEQKPSLAAKVLKAQRLCGEFTEIDAFLSVLKQTVPMKLPGETHEVQRVAVCGFYYSGSTAIFEFLQQHRQVFAWPPNQAEFRLLAEQGGFHQLLESVLERGRMEMEALCDLALHMFGERPPSISRRFSGSHTHANNEYRKIARSDYLMPWWAACRRSLEFLMSRAEEEVSPEEAEQLVRESLGVLLATLAYEAAAESIAIVLDQAPHVMNLTAALAMPPTRFLIVSRDPRDQFVDGNNARKRQKRALMKLGPFVARYRRLEALVEDQVPKMKAAGHQVMRVRFEDFVRHGEVRERVASFCGLDCSGMDLGSRFDPAVSIGNVGLHRQAAGDTMKAIKDALEEYTVD